MLDDRLVVEDEVERRSWQVQVLRCPWCHMEFEIRVKSVRYCGRQRVEELIFIKDDISRSDKVNFKFGVISIKIGR